MTPVTHKMVEDYFGNIHRVAVREEPARKEIMMDRTLGAQERRPTVRDRIDKLHALMTEALAAEARIIGDSPQEDKSGKPTDYALDVIEYDLDGALEKASKVVRQLEEIERRL
jgi:hypothetical protein